MLPTLSPMVKSPHSQSRTAELRGLLIGGDWIQGPERAIVIDKYSGDVVEELVRATPADVDRAIADAVRAADMPFPHAEREAVLLRAADLLMERSQQIVRQYVAETGFPEADGVGELGRAVSTLRLCAAEAVRIAGEEIPLSATTGSENRLGFVTRVPVGVVVAIAPFNAPLNTVMHKVGPAIAAGNAVVLKPAESTPLSSLAIAEALLDAGLPAGRIQVVVGSGSSIGDVIVSDPRVGFITFTGSTAVGLRIKQTSGIVRTHFELGSNSATIVADDADLDLVTRLVPRAAYRKAGQVCTSVQRLLVTRSSIGELAERLREAVSGLDAGDPRADGTSVGPMIAEKEAMRALDWIGEASANGAEVLTGGERQGALLLPTLLLNPPGDSRIMMDEAFAPVLSITPIDSVDQGIALVNSGPYGLQAGLFTRDIDRAFDAAKRLRVGGVIINDTSSYHADAMPYGGVKQSGYGLEGPRYAVQDMTDPRLIVMNLQPPVR